MEGLNMPELAAQKQAEEDQKKANEEQRELYICSILTVDARERLNRIALVKPEKAR
jgi:DNA-binding TFAR19-related protein (PDSD5 family)